MLRLRCQEAAIFGVRPIDQHLKGFMALGAEYKLEGGMVNVSADHLTGNNVYLDVVPLEPL